MKDLYECDILIVGAGLTGLVLAHSLRDTSWKIAVVESRDRIGGRIVTEGYVGNTPVEMGATWVGAEHKHLNQLIDYLGVELFEQKIGSKAIYEPISTSPHYLASLPDNPVPSYRIKGGTFALIDALRKNINNIPIFLSERVKSIYESGDSIEVNTEVRTFFAKKVITTLPPYLFVNSIKCSPALPSELIRVAQNTHTWMGESIKIGITYDKPFWRNADVAGTIFSNVGPIPEMYDHSNYEESHFSLVGFLNGSYHVVSKEERLELILNQLEKYFGAEVRHYKQYHEKLWCKEADTFANYSSSIIPHQNNGHRLYQKAYMNNKLVISGAETSSVHPGYMEGAVKSALYARKWI